MLTLEQIISVVYKVSRYGCCCQLILRGAGIIFVGFTATEKSYSWIILRELIHSSFDIHRRCSDY